MNNPNGQPSMRVLGMDRLYIRCSDAAAMREWYRRCLGVAFDDRGQAWFPWNDPETGTRRSLALRFVESQPGGEDGAEPPIVVRYRAESLEPLIQEGQHSDASGVITLQDPENREVQFIAGNSAGAENVEGKIGAETHVRGLGGVFLRSPNPNEVKRWYWNLGVVPGEGGYVTFTYVSASGVTRYIVWEVFPQDTTYFDCDGKPSNHPYMVNLRVQDLDGLLSRARRAGAWVDPSVETHEYGKFAWTRDPTGARVELWEAPLDSEGAGSDG